MIYEQDCYNLKIEYFNDLIEINIKNISNNFMRFKIYENILPIFEINDQIFPIGKNCKKIVYV